MPRQKRLNLPGGVYHVLTRGIERRRLFRDSNDYNEFLRRFELGLEKTGAQCFAWALMPNHVHLMIRLNERPLSDLMRGLLSGYASYFNCLFQIHIYIYVL